MLPVSAALCAEDPNGNVPLGKSCERYWSCQGGYPRLMRCPATLVFDKVSRRCVHPPTDDCDVPPTESPEELGEEPPQQNQRGRRPSAQSVPQELDEPEYYDEEEFDPGFSAASGPQELPPQSNRASTPSRQPPARPQFRQGAPRPPLRGPAIPAGATLVN